LEYLVRFSLTRLLGTQKAPDLSEASSPNRPATADQPRVAATPRERDPELGDSRLYRVDPGLLRAISLVPVETQSMRAGLTSLRRGDARTSCTARQRRPCSSNSEPGSSSVSPAMMSSRRRPFGYLNVTSESMHPTYAFAPTATAGCTHPEQALRRLWAIKGCPRFGSRGSCRRVRRAKAAGEGWRGECGSRRAPQRRRPACGRWPGSGHGVARRLCLR
jgi:hypothetical protein